ncbi:MAG: TRAP transporter small permease [Deltaproteobacteria bacterium]|nr:TRAP transporter small permease [Deltaproteobacteria bacterium]
MIRQIENYLLKVISFILVLQGLGLVVLIGLEVFFRYVVGSALSWPEEVAGIVFVWFTLLGIALVMREDEHIAFDYLMKHSPPVVGKIIMAFSLLVIQIYALTMIYYGYSYARTFSFETTPAARINLLWLNLSLPVSGLLIIIYSLLKVVELFKSPGRKAE